MIQHHAHKCRRMLERVVSFEGVYDAVEHSVTRDSIKYLTKHPGLIISRILIDSSRSSGGLLPDCGLFCLNRQALSGAGLTVQTGLRFRSGRRYTFRDRFPRVGGDCSLHGMDGHFYLCVVGLSCGQLLQP